MILTRILLFIALSAAPFGFLQAQGSYEIQVYGSELVAPGATMFELHSNFTFEGSKTVVNGQYPTEHQLHETLEITHGFSDWFELGFYVFTSADSRVGWQWVGDHIRPRVAIPESWKWPVGVSLSTEIGYQRAVYSPDTWTIEIRPIVDKTIGRAVSMFQSDHPIGRFTDHRFRRASHSLPTLRSAMTSRSKSTGASNTTVRSVRLRDSIRYSSNSSRSSQSRI